MNQTYKNIEIIVVDDGSTDNTLSRICEFKDDRIKIIQHKNMGFVNSIIKAIQQASGELIAIHGSGDYSHPLRIEKQVELIKNEPSIGVVGCYVKKVDLVEGKENIFRPVIPENNLLSYIKYNNPFTHGEVMFKKEVYDKVGGYRSFFMYSQDRDLWMRMSLHTKFGVVPEVLYTRYNLPGGGVSRSPEKVIMQKYFNEVSRQCIDMKVKGEADLIEKYGYYAPFFLKRSKTLSNDIFKKASSEYLKGNLNDAIKFIDLSINERKSFLNLSLKLLLIVSQKNSYINKFIRNTIIKMKGIIKKLF